MEYVDGESPRGPMAADEALAIAMQIAETLSEAHQTGIIHRDLKPANIKITPAGKVKVVDFGLAKALDAESSGLKASADLTQSPTMIMRRRCGNEPSSTIVGRTSTRPSRGTGALSPVLLVSSSFPRAGYMAIFCNLSPRACELTLGGSRGPTLNVGGILAAGSRCGQTARHNQDPAEQMSRRSADGIPARNYPRLVAVGHLR